MNNRIIALLAFLALILPFAGGTAHAIGIEAAIGAWNQDPRGDISYKGTELDVENDLKYSDKLKIMGRVKLEAPLIPNIYLMATPMEFKGDGSKAANFQFANKTFNVSQPFKSKLRLDHYDVALYYGIPLLKTATANTLNLELGVNARIIDFKAEVTGTEAVTGNQINESKTLTVPVPMLYVGAQVRPVKWLSAEAELRGIIYGKNQYTDLIGRAKLKVLGPAFVAAGYRYERIKLDISDVKATTTFRGPFGEVGVEF